MLKINLLHYFGLGIYYRSTVSVLKILIAIVIVVFEIPIVNNSDSIGHHCPGCKFLGIWLGDSINVSSVFFISLLFSTPIAFTISINIGLFIAFT